MYYVCLPSGNASQTLGSVQFATTCSIPLEWTNTWWINESHWEHACSESAHKWLKHSGNILQFLPFLWKAVCKHISRDCMMVHFTKDLIWSPPWSVMYRKHLLVFSRNVRYGYATNLPITPFDNISIRPVANPMSLLCLSFHFWLMIWFAYF